MFWEILCRFREFSLDFRWHIIHGRLQPNGPYQSNYLAKKSSQTYSVKFLWNGEMAEIKGLYPSLSIDLSVFTLKIWLQNLSFSIDFIDLRHNSSLMCYFPEIISIL